MSLIDTSFCFLFFVFVQSVGAFLIIFPFMIRLFAFAYLFGTYLLLPFFFVLTLFVLNIITTTTRWYTDILFCDLFAWFVVSFSLSSFENRSASRAHSLSFLFSLFVSAYIVTLPHPTVKWWFLFYYFRVFTCVLYNIAIYFHRVCSFCSVSVVVLCSC